MTITTNLFNIKTNPFKAVSFVESAVMKSAERAGSLIAAVKYDGVRGNILTAPKSGAAWLSRVGKTIPALEHLNGFEERWDALLNDDRCFYPQGFMLDGELMVIGETFQKSSGYLRTQWSDPKNHHLNANQNAFGITKKSAKVPFMLNAAKLHIRLYAVLPLDRVQGGEDIHIESCLMQIHVQQMVPLLNDYFPEITWDMEEVYDVFDMQSLNELYEEKRAEGHEGLIVKDPYAPYRRGKKTGWWKMKPENEADGIVVGLNWGTPGLANEGKVIGFMVELESGVQVAANGISQALMAEFTAAVGQASGWLTPQEVGLIHDEPEAMISNPYEGWQCQVSFMEYTEDGSLRHPSWDCWRGTEADPTVKI